MPGTRHSGQGWAADRLDGSQADMVGDTRKQECWVGDTCNNHKAIQNGNNSFDVPPVHHDRNSSSFLNFLKFGDRETMNVGKEGSASVWAGYTRSLEPVVAMIWVLAPSDPFIWIKVDVYWECMGLSCPLSPIGQSSANWSRNHHWMFCKQEWFYS